MSSLETIEATPQTAETHHSAVSRALRRGLGAMIAGIAILIPVTLVADTLHETGEEVASVVGFAGGLALFGYGFVKAYNAGASEQANS